ncbi:MAG: CYTH domain-containing protein [Bacteroidales bacterium]|nr:CYTH domain-containing protein [Bacteroidales bacterium]
MAKEIERKFLVIDNSYLPLAVQSYAIAQGYLCRDPERTVRVRISGEKAFLTIKGVSIGAEREEYEYEIPLSDGQRLLSLCVGRVIRKHRHIVPCGQHLWEVDQFEDSLAPLVVAEVELSSADEEIELPAFVGEEVTGDPSYYNSNL